MNYILFHFFVKPFSRLPYWVLYRVSDFLYLLLYRVLHYRVKVVRTNLKNSFPEKSASERLQIERKFYQHFYDLIIESVKQFSITKEEVIQRCEVHNYEVMDAYAKQGKSVFLVAGHYGNWELASVASELYTLHQVCGIYHPLKNKYWDKKLQESRSQYGLALVSKHALAGYFDRTKSQMNLTIFATDQSPSNPERAYWMEFLNQDTPVFYGAEKLSKQYDQPVVWGEIKKLKRGHYRISFELITDQPREMAYGAITEDHVRRLEQQIRRAPEYWLWTHKRWKRTRPDNNLELRDKYSKREAVMMERMKTNEA